MGEWNKVAFSQLCDITRGASPRPINDWFVDSGIPWVKISDANSAQSRYITQTGQYIKPEGKSKSVEVHPGDLILSNSATPGIPKFMGIDACIHDGWLLLRNLRGLDKNFAYYLLLHERPKLLAQGSGSIFINLKTEILKNHLVSIPPLPEQRAIAHILGTLDDKIELNRRQSQTLQAMARALFKAWFVDFEPVRAKQQGRWQRGQTLPGLPAHLYDLFPDSLQETEHGEVPLGWETVLLGDFIETVKGRSYKSTELAPSATALVTLKSFARGGGYRAEGLKSYTGVYKLEQVVEPGEVVIACTDVTQAAEVIGRAAIVRKVQQYQTLVASLDTIIVRPRSERITRMFLYHLGRSERFVAHTCSHVTGTTVLHLGKNAVPSFQFAMPPQSLVHYFDEMATGMFARVTALEEEEQYLADLRDTLLPKLISGALRVADAEAFLAARGCC